VPSLLSPVLLPPMLVLRALDDLHTLAVTARAAVEVGERVVELGERIVTMGERLDARGEAILGVGAQLERRAEAILDLGARLDASGAAMHGLGERMQAQGEVLEAVARDVATRGAEVAAALPLLERAVALGEPLEGTVERLGRIVDRLPGGAQARRRATRPDQPTG